MSVPHLPCEGAAGGKAFLDTRASASDHDRAAVQRDSYTTSDSSLVAIELADRGDYR